MDSLQPVVNTVSLTKVFWSDLDVELHQTALDIRGADGELGRRSVSPCQHQVVTAFAQGQIQTAQERLQISIHVQDHFPQQRRAPTYFISQARGRSGDQADQVSGLLRPQLLALDEFGEHAIG